MSGSGASVAGKLTGFRDLAWWSREQRLTVGCRRRRRRHYPREKAIGEVAGGEAWKAMAANRSQWREFEEAWVRAQQVSWSSCPQSALCF